MAHRGESHMRTRTQEEYEEDLRQRIARATEKATEKATENQALEAANALGIWDG